MDNRLALAFKYHDDNMPDAAWTALREILAEAEVDPLTLRFAAALRLEMFAYDDVLQLCDRMNDAWSRGLKAHVLQRLGRIAEAEAALRAGLIEQPNNPATWNDLGNILDEQGKVAEAKSSFERAIQLDPTFSAAHTNLGAHLASQGYFAAAAASHQHALNADPANTIAHINLGVAFVEQGRIESAIEAFDAALTLAPQNADAADNRLYAALYHEPDPATICAAHQAWGRTLPPAVPVPHDRNANRRLRIGYVSPDFRRHSVAFFIEPLLANHDPAAVEVFCYADVAQPDAVTACLKASVPHWRETSGLSHAQLHQQILADGIDVLVDLAGHTKGNRLPVFAHRAAPVQVTALGYAATTGVPAMDYRLCDVGTDPPPEFDSYATETLIRLPSGLHCYAPPSAAPAVAPLPALKNGFVTYGSFNKFAKISPATIEVWAAILKTQSTARLILKSKALAEDVTRSRISSAFADHGVAPERLELIGWAGDDAAHLGLYGRIDVALDTYPYNGTTTTCEALWMGVPVLSLAGRSHAARVGASLLSRVGLTDWLCGAAAELPARAQMLTDFKTLAELRAALRTRVAASPLCDGKSYARGIEAAYRAMWLTGS